MTNKINDVATIIIGALIIMITFNMVGSLDKHEPQVRQAAGAPPTADVYHQAWCSDCCDERYKVTWGVNLICIQKNYTIKFSWGHPLGACVNTTDYHAVTCWLPFSEIKALKEASK